MAKLRLTDTWLSAVTDDDTMLAYLSDGAPPDSLVRRFTR